MNVMCGIKLHFAPSGLRILWLFGPRVAPWAIAFGPLGAFIRALPPELVSSLPSIESIEAELSRDLEQEPVTGSLPHSLLSERNK